MLAKFFNLPIRGFLLVIFILSAVTSLNASEFNKIKKAARGQTVYFNAWGGDTKINRYISWVANILSERHDITLRHVKLTNTATAVSRILAEKASGRNTRGSIDLLWVNGENFAAMKRAELLQDQPWVTSLPNWRYTNSNTLPGILLDFGETTEGKESPWGRAQLVFSYDSKTLKSPPRSAAALADYISLNPGRFTFPQPPDFIGMSFLKQILIELNDSHTALYQPVTDSSFATITAPLWNWLDKAKPNLWRSGTAYPANYAVLRQLLADGAVDIAIAFNPTDSSSAIARGELPSSVRTYIHDIGTLANVHFVAIPFNASAPEAAKVVANFLLSPEAQAKKADIAIWGDPTVLSMPKLSDTQRMEFTRLPRGVASLSENELARTLAEPHPSWVPRIQSAWIKRYASGQ